MVGVALDDDGPRPGTVRYRFMLAEMDKVARLDEMFQPQNVGRETGWQFYAVIVLSRFEIVSL